MSLTTEILRDLTINMEHKARRTHRKKAIVEEP
jgi:hypothetical protein